MTLVDLTMSLYLAGCILAAIIAGFAYVEAKPQYSVPEVLCQAGIAAVIWPVVVVWVVIRVIAHKFTTAKT